jgi:orotidine-5'-phosphate decarboxylase
MTGPEDDARQHLAIALDVDDLVAALRIARPLLEYFSVAKVGSELFAASGPEAVVALSSAGFEVFVDLKLHDIPTTVGRTARVLGALGVSYATVHASGGRAMVEAATAGMADGARSAALPDPCVLGVTVLTSDPEADSAELASRARIAFEAGCGGIVCAGTDLAIVSAVAPGLRLVVPGIRPSDTALDDQARVATPAAAIRGGADLLVVGRAVTAASDPEAAAIRLREEVASALGEMSHH